MTRLNILASSVVVLSLAMPLSAGAQRRGGGESGGGSAGGRTSSEPSAGTAQPRSAPSAPSAPMPSGDRGSSPSSARDSGSPRTSSRPSTSTNAVRASGGGAAVSRNGEQRVVRGTAQPRGNQPIIRGGSNADVYFYNYYGYPWYSGGSHFGYLGLYSPFYYGRAGWGWGGFGYGYWHDPYLYDPYSYYSGPWPYYWDSPGYTSRSRSSRDDDDQPMGSIRLRVSPRTAKVYVDGALAGVVDEFDGLSNHLRLPVGRHQIELRAEGYETESQEVNVKAGTTSTVRIGLNGKK